MKRGFFRELIRGFRFKILMLAVLGVGGSACGVYMAWLSKSVVDMATRQAEGNLLAAGLLLGSVMLVQLGFQVGITILHVHTSAGIRFRLQGRLFESLLKKKKLSVDSFHSGELVHRLAGDTIVVSEGAAEILPSAASISARIILSFAALVVLDPALAGICILAGLILLAVARIYRKKTGDIFKKTRESEGWIRSFIQESIQNLAVIKAFSVGAVIKSQLKMAQKNAYALTLRQNKLSIGANVCFYIAMSAGYYLILAWSAWRIFRGEITFGTMTAILSLTGDITTPFRQLASLFPQYMSVCASAERLEELDELPEDFLPPAKDPKPVYDKMKCIRLENVSFAYADGTEVLNRASASFDKGIMTAVMGESGAGKSTMLGLLTGIITPDFGSITIDTDDELSYDVAEYRRMFAYVPQEFLLLSGDVRQNITLFDDNVDEARLQRAIHMAELDEVVKDLPQGLQTFLGEGGGRLSGGQRQRMAIARAIYSEADVLLLDECTSALSDGIQEKVLKNLKESRKTVIFVTHRKTAAAVCQKVYKADEGKLKVL